MCCTWRIWVRCWAGDLERLVVGTGAYGRMRAAAGLEQELSARGVEC